jgi:hypothetical protein
MFRDDLPQLGAGLTVPQMLKASPQHYGTVKNLHISPFYTFLPLALQKFIARIWCFSFLAPKWESRYLILLGSFLYKFTDEAPTNPKMNPKGSPVPIESVNAQVIEPSLLPADHPMGVALHNLPPGCTCVFSVSDFRKTRYYAVTNKEQALTWVNSLLEAQQETIRRTMGHAPTASFPKAWVYFDSLGRSLLKRKDRIRARMEEISFREMEMSDLAPGGPLPRGYHG